MYALGLDIGSSSVKAALVNIATGTIVSSASSPAQHELPISTPQPGWAEQHPDLWYDHTLKAVAKIAESHADKLKQTACVGISYQMHGLVCVDKDGLPLRPAIIWCDSRTSGIEDVVLDKNGLGLAFCQEHYLNTPGNFTASKLRWVQLNEPDIYAKIAKVMLPGDYIATKLGGPALTTISGLSEGIMYDFQTADLAIDLLKVYNIDPSLICTFTDSFGDHGHVSADAAAKLGIPAGASITYRAGDQPNNAFSLNVVNPGEVAANAGTSGVVYGVSSVANYDPQMRVNTFAHVSYLKQAPKYGILGCVNGTGIFNSWVRKLLSTFLPTPLGYPELNALAAASPVGSNGLLALPFGNGSERYFNNKPLGASFLNLDFNRHNSSNVLRATQEGIAFALQLNIEVMQSMGMDLKVIKAGYANMCLSPVFTQTLANLANVPLELYNADGAAGAARASAIGAGLLAPEEAHNGLKNVSTVTPNADAQKLGDVYALWKEKVVAQFNLIKS